VIRLSTIDVEFNPDARPLDWKSGDVVADVALDLVEDVEFVDDTELAMTSGLP
jgi:hypothetical protein